jgi:hypothetical protein
MTASVESTTVVPPSLARDAFAHRVDPDLVEGVAEEPFEPQSRSLSVLVLRCPR